MAIQEFGTRGSDPGLWTATGIVVMCMTRWPDLHLGDGLKLRVLRSMAVDAFFGDCGVSRLAPVWDVPSTLRLGSIRLTTHDVHGGGVKSCLAGLICT